MNAKTRRSVNQELIKEHITALAVRYYRFSKRYSTGSILTLGLIFFAVSVFFNRSTAAGLFASLERYSHVSQEFWAGLVIGTIILISTHLSWSLQIVGCFILLGCVIILWASVISYGLAWQGISLFTITSVIFIKSNLDEVVERYLRDKVE